MFMLHKCSKFLQKKLFFLFLSAFSLTSICFLRFQQVSKSKEIILNSYEPVEIVEGFDPTYAPRTNMAKYFYFLGDNFSINEYGSCGYVAMSMLLGYYDAFCYDNILDQYYTEDETLIGYEVDGTPTHSPGVHPYFGLEDYLKSKNQSLTYSNLTQFLRTANPESLQSRLLYLATTKNILTQYKFNNVSGGTLGTDLSSMKEVLKAFFTSQGLTEGRDYTIELSLDWIDDTTMISRLKTILEDGNPVILSMHSPSRGGHAVVAYDYNESQNLIYCHTGQQRANTTCFVSNYFGNISGYLYIKMRGTKHHSDNYYKNGITFCGCELNIYG